MRINIDDTDGDSDGARLYNGVAYTGEIVETDGEGHLIYLSNYEGGYENGPYREWYADGGLKTEGQTDRGILAGVWRTWHENGQLAEESVYDNGKRTRHRMWAEDGTPTADHPRTTA